MKVWITKYALSSGIVETEAEVDGDMIEVPGRFNSYFHGKGKDWHADRESAITRAEKMRRDKLMSVNRQRRKLEALSFS